MSSRAFTNEQAKTLDPRLKMSRMTEGGLCYDNGSQAFHFHPLGCRRYACMRNYVAKSANLTFTAVSTSISVLPSSVA